MIMFSGNVGINIVFAVELDFCVQQKARLLSNCKLFTYRVSSRFTPLILLVPSFWVQKTRSLWLFLLSSFQKLFQFKSELLQNSIGLERNYTISKKFVEQAKAFETSLDRSAL